MRGKRNTGGILGATFGQCRTGPIDFSSYVETGTITNGIDIAYGAAFDAKANLYIANEGSATIQEYKKGATSPTFSYTAGLSDPHGVAVDKTGHVFVADGAGSTVDEFAQHKNSLVAQCNLAGAAFGVAVDTKGDVFVSYKSSSFNGNLGEFKHGLKGCNQTVLGVKVGYAGGLAVDLKKNLVACDQSGAVVDIIAPPYTTITSMITGFTQPVAVAFNASSKLIFVSDYGASDIFVDDYPSGSPVTTVGSSAGISEPLGVAVYPVEK